MWLRATSREWINTWAPARAGKMASWCANMPATRILYLREEAVLRTPHVLNQAIAVLRRSVGLPGRFITVWKIEPDTPPTTVTLGRMRMRVNKYNMYVYHVCTMGQRHWQYLGSSEGPQITQLTPS